MKWLYRNLYRKEKGFTLVELMIVIIILAILTGIAIPSYMALRNRARVSASRSEMANIGTALELYMADIEFYPVAGGAGGWVTPAAAIQAGGYMNNVPMTDAWGAGYVYARPSTANYTLTSLGSDGAAGGTGYAADIVMTNGNLP